MTRIRLAQNVMVELREAARAELVAQLGSAEARLVAERAAGLYQGQLRQIAAWVGISAEAITGFDDVSGELILTDDTPVPRRRR